MKHLILIEN